MCLKSQAWTSLSRRNIQSVITQKADHEILRIQLPKSTYCRTLLPCLLPTTISISHVSKVKSRRMKKYHEIVQQIRWFGCLLAPKWRLQSLLSLSKKAFYTKLQVLWITKSSPKLHHCPPRHLRKCFCNRTLARTQMRKLPKSPTDKTIEVQARARLGLARYLARELCQKDNLFQRSWAQKKSRFFNLRRIHFAI